jgi:hypothetical protein
MSDWNRITHEISLENLPSEMKTEIERHIQFYNLGDILSDALICIQTDSEKVKRGLFVGAEVVNMAAVLTPRWLVWVANGTKTSTVTLSALLADVVIQDYADTQFAKLVPDSGIEVNGKFTGATENASAFIGLQENAAGKKFKEIAIRAVQEAKK